jgi:hypothetical protein
MRGGKMHAVHKLSAQGLNNKQSTWYNFKYAIDTTIRSELTNTTSSVAFKGLLFFLGGVGGLSGPWNQSEYVRATPSGQANFNRK